MEWKLVLSISTILLLHVLVQADVGDGTSKASDVQNKMYEFLRTMALPDSKPDEEIKQRFVLQIPGKLLNPNDYDEKDPSRDKTLQKLEYSIPPKIAENMFRLSDITPAADPIKAGETGESFLDAYDSVLNNMYVRDYNEKNTAIYSEAIDFLSEKIPDPYEEDKTVARFEMYKTLQEKYNTISNDMENVIEVKRKELIDNPIDFQIWFQNNYPSLHAKVENAYTEWIVFGQKDLVESYKAKLDISSTGTILGKAKSILRASGKQTQDRASTYYPVYFEPSNWYDYLRLKQLPPTREEIQMKIGDIDAKLVTLQSYNPDNPSDEVKKKIAEFEKKTEETEKLVKDKTNEISKQKLACFGQEDDDNTESKDKTKPKDDKSRKEKNSKACKEYYESSRKLQELTTQYAMQKAKADNAKFQFYVGKESKANLDRLIKTLTARKERLEQQLQDAKTPDISEVKDVDPDEAVQDIRKGWMEFEFSYDSESKKEDASSTSTSTSVEASYNNILYSVSVGASYSRSSSDFSQDIKSENVKISGKLLKVVIKRPWFKSSLFKNELIKMKGGLSVAPGINTEEGFIRNINSEKDNYILPEFASAFLLAKDIVMEFTGVESSTKSHTLEQSASGKLSGNYLCFSASASFDYGSSESSLQTESTANGLKIKIPGAQIVGYYTTLLPCFPRDSEKCKNKK